MRLLVTGGSGYVGAAILKRAPANWQIAATYLAHPIQLPHVAAFCVDVRDARAVNQFFDEFRPDAVLHTAALMFGNEMMATNIDGSRNVARAASQHHSRLIHLSSDVIFDGEHAPYTESDAPAPITPYAESKARAEQVVIDESADPLIVRTSLVYGFDPVDPRTHQVLSGEMSRLFTDEYRCPIFVDDLADALIELATSLRAERSNPYSILETPAWLCPSSGTVTCGASVASSQPLRAPRNDKSVSVINIAGPQRLSRYAFGLKLVRALGAAPKFQPALSASSPSPRPRDCALDISRAQKFLRTRLRSVDEVLSHS